jgi:UDP-N-acetylmuramate-alanine ligase
MKKVSWKGKRVLILGLGQYPKGSGISAALYALKQGAEVCVTDHKTAKELEGNVKILKAYSGVRYRLGGHDLRDIDWADIVIRNPRVRYSSPEMVYARKQGKQIESAESLFFQACPCPIVGITGTRGKSTTTTLVYDMLAATPRKGRVGGGANKALGQHFLIDRSALEAIVSAANIQKGDQVLEIGPGLGVLTESLLIAAARAQDGALRRAWQPDGRSFPVAGRYRGRTLPARSER